MREDLSGMSGGWVPPDQRARVDRRARAVRDCLEYLERVPAAEAGRWASPAAAAQLRRHGPALIAWLAEALATLPERGWRP